MSVLNKLTEGIVERSLSREGAALLDKWEKTGLLEGLDNDQNKNGMARLLENQAAQLLKEASAMASGDVEGFASVAFPIVRRVFGGLIANDLVSVQPMSLPSGLIFFLDFIHGDSGTAARLGSVQGQSLYGGGVVGQQLTGGMNLSDFQSGSFEKSFYNLDSGYASPTGSLGSVEITNIHTGTYGGEMGSVGVDNARIPAEEAMKMFRFDPNMTSGSTMVAVGDIDISSIVDFGDWNSKNLIGLTLSDSADGSANSGSAGLLRGGGENLGATPVNAVQLRRLTDFSGSSTGTVRVCFAQSPAEGGTLAELSGALTHEYVLSYPRMDTFTETTAADAPGAIAGAATWALENAENIPEIEIKVDSVAVTAMTKKLKAKWTPELGQDLNAYHNLDAEVELTSILSEQIALEIDREILNDLVKGATAGTYYWARSPGLFVNRTTGTEVGQSSAAPDFTGTVSEWYETLVETINDVSAQIHRKTLRGGANFIVTSPEVANILEFTSGFRASVTGDSDKGTVGAVKTGAISKKWDVYVDPYFPRNVVLVGRKGGSFLESGYVYAPYVPLQVTPTIFGPEDFVPRKGVMTRYAKKMVRPDMYGVVVVRGLLGEAGATS